MAGQQGMESTVCVCVCLCTSQLFLCEGAVVVLMQIFLHPF